MHELLSFCGAEEIRTPDLLLAKEALSLLSYSPIIFVSGSMADFIQANNSKVSVSY